MVDLQPSLPACISLSALGGLLEVSSTMCLAYPEFRAKRGRPYGPCVTRSLLPLNLGLMAIASVMYIVGSWFGPVSISVPTVMVSKLLCNLAIMGVVLRMQKFSHEQKVGTYVIMCGCVAPAETRARARRLQRRMAARARVAQWLR